jgi:Bacterial lectin/Abnormal spindle-like microcephaly-assoc'd, ASPM-SPD-2-Hydin
VSVDGTQYLSQAVTLGANVLVGFGGGTGGLTDVHSVKNVVITSGATSTAPALSVSPASVPFGNVAVGSSGQASVVVSNVGNAPLTVSSVTGPSAPFAATGLPAGGATIAAGASVTGTVTFSPSSASASTGSIAFQTNGGNATVSLSGTGTSGSGPVSIPAPAAGVWQLNGSSSLPSAGVLQLTPATANQAGSAFYPTAVSSSTLTAEFDATINGGSGADGLTFVLANPAAGATPTSLGDSGGGLGFLGTPGVAVALDTYKNAVNPSANFVGITDGPAAGGLHWLATSTAVPNLRSATRHVKVTVAAGVMTVSVDGTQYLSQAVTLGANVLVGFGGGTGGLTDVHSVKNVVITVG